MSDLVGAYEDEEDARAAFIAVRLGRMEPADWAQLASVPDDGRAQLLCWYGQDVPAGQPPAPLPPEPIPAPSEPVRRRFLRWRRRETS